VAAVILNLGLRLRILEHVLRAHQSAPWLMGVIERGLLVVFAALLVAAAGAPAPRISQGTGAEPTATGMPGVAGFRHGRDQSALRAGFNGGALNQGLFFFGLKPIEERSSADQSARAVVQRLNHQFQKIEGAKVMAQQPAAVPGFSVQGGLSFQFNDLRRLWKTQPIPGRMGW